MFNVEKQSQITDTLRLFYTKQNSLPNWCSAILVAWLDRANTIIYLLPFLCAYLIFASVFFCVAYANSDLHFDVLETWNVGRSFNWGFWKHPPLMGWIAHIWSTVFPQTTWSFRWLAMANSTVGLFFVDQIVRRFAPNNRRLIVLILLLLTPVYDFHAEKFNANAVLLATWPAATYCFLRSFEERSNPIWSIATGALSTLAMLGKYYSIFLIVGFIVASLLHPERRRYLLSYRPWLAVLIGCLTIAPHILWLVRTGFSPFQYALTEHTGRGLNVSLWNAVLFWLTNLGYLVLPAIAWQLIRPGRTAFWTDLRSLESGLLLIAIIFLTGILLPPLIVCLIGSDLPAAWHLQALFMPVVVVVCSYKGNVAPREYIRFIRNFSCLALFALAMAPIHALYRNYHPLPRGRQFYHRAADRVSAIWQQNNMGRLAYVTGDDGLAFGMAFYGKEHPIYEHDIIPTENRKSLSTGGLAVLCFSDDASCVARLNDEHARYQNAKTQSFMVGSSLWGLKGSTKRVTVLMIPLSNSP